MSTKDVKRYFGPNVNTDIQWLNDSSCIINFDDEEECAKVYRLANFRAAPFLDPSAIVE